MTITKKMLCLNKLKNLKNDFLMKNVDGKGYVFPSKLPIIVFDAGALITGIDISNLADDNHCFTTRNIFEEEIKNLNRKSILKSYVKSQILNIPEYEIQDFSKIEQYAKRSGDLKSLSLNDRGILALCLYLYRSYKKQYNTVPKLILITDDYSIQNVARLLEIPTQSFKYKGIKKFIQWEIYCKNCFKIYNASMYGKECLVCGDIIQRRPIKRKKNK